MSAIRTFVAVTVSEDLRSSISEVQETLKSLTSDIRWVAPENLHVTMKFLGNLDEGVLPKVFEAVQEAAQSNRAFTLSVSGLGAFPSPQKARVVWVGVDDGREELVKLAAAVEDQLVKAGFAKEDKEFRAHITIGRARDRFARGLAEAMSEVGPREMGKQEVAGLAVIESDLQPGGPVYTVLRNVDLPL